MTSDLGEEKGREQVYRRGDQIATLSPAMAQLNASELREEHRWDASLDQGTTPRETGGHALQKHAARHCKLERSGRHGAADGSARSDGKKQPRVHKAAKSQASPWTAGAPTGPKS